MFKCQEILILCCLGLAVAGLSGNIQGKILLKDKFPVTAVQDVQFGWGYSSLTLKETYSKVVDVDMVSSPTLKESGIIDLVYGIKLCTSTVDYRSFISGALSVSGTYMGVTVKPSIKVLTEVKMTSLDSMLLAHIDITTDTKVAVNPRFTKHANDLLSGGKYEEFVESYGTHFLKEVILGGKMILVMKFSSSTKESKKELETKLGAYTGGFSAEAEFSAKLHELKEHYSMEMHLLAQGSNLAPPHPDITQGIEYAVDFARNVRNVSVVKEVHYTGLWSLPSAPLDLKPSIFSLQAKTEQLVRIATSLSDSECQIDDIFALRHTEMGYFSQVGWKKCEQIRLDVQQIKESLNTKFRVIVNDLAELDNLIMEFENKDEMMEVRIESLLKAEKTFYSGNNFTLKSNGALVYISWNQGNYPTLDTASYIPLTFQSSVNSSGLYDNREIKYGLAYTYFLTSTSKPGFKLCMGENNWYVHWIAKEKVKDDVFCSWSVFHALNVKRRVLQYGDSILIYNKKYSDYVIGVSEDSAWLEDIPATKVSDTCHQWFVGKLE